jgi:hypothetical protein
MIFGQLLTGSSFDDSIKKVTGYFFVIIFQGVEMAMEQN